jgi:cytochrome c oxidase subunit 3/cytochrome o ubiquinol oxidase subunit 3
MSTVEIGYPERAAGWSLPSRGRVGMYCLIAAEAAIFTIFVVAYLFYLGKSISGPLPKDVLHAPIFYSVCLLASSLTVHIAVRRVTSGEMGAFARWWLATILLGGTFLFGTAREWAHLILDEGLTVSTNLFGTTYYSLVGLHAFHVTAGLIALLAVATFHFAAELRPGHAERVEILAMYWHFVDAVWVVVFTVVYVIGV